MRFTISHPNGRGTGCTACFELTDDNKFVNIILEPQLKGYQTGFVAGFDDICKMLQVMRGECENINMGKGIWRSDNTTSRGMFFEHRLCDGPYYDGAYELCVVNFEDKNDKRVNTILIKGQEALGLCIGFERVIELMVVGK